MSAKEAAAFLGVKLATLYAYASRGLLHSLPGPGPRARSYLRSDIEQLRAKSFARSGHGPVAASALRWGEPVLDSAITAIDADGPRYRGHGSVSLARAGTTFESVARLLWTGALPTRTAPFSALPDVPVPALARTSPPLLRLSVLLPLLAARDVDRLGASRAREEARAEGIVASLARFVGPTSVPAQSSVAATLCAALGLLPRPRTLSALDAALVLCADHELNASAFVARVAASAGADLYACLLAAMATLSGPRHGGECDRIDALLEEVRSPARAAAIVRARAGRGEVIPGFGHQLYPDGDPRSPPLLELAAALGPRRAGGSTLVTIARAMKEERGLSPAVDFALVALANALGAPPGSAAALFGVGRAAGWIAHVFEQREQGGLLRPRARYVGPSSA